jgi:hypothetical protein
MFKQGAFKKCIKNCCISLLFIFPVFAHCQVNPDSLGLPLIKDSSLIIHRENSVLRIKNFSPFFTIHVDSTLDYQFESNKDPHQYYWYLRNSPVGLKINKDNGELHFKADKSYFLSGKLKYDFKYIVQLGIQNLDHPEDRIDTAFTLIFYNTEIIPSKIKPTIGNDVVIGEGDTLNFRLQCEDGSFPIESINYYCNYPINSLTTIAHCGDTFTWVAPYDFIKADDIERLKAVNIKFIGVDKWSNHDTTELRVLVKQSINFPLRVKQYNKIYKETGEYIIQLKRTFRILDEKIRHTKNSRTTFDLTSASTALGGTIFSSMQSSGAKTTGTILPSVGVALVPVKEAVAPAKADVQNSASLVRSDIKRLEYLLSDNALVSEKDPEIIRKTQKIQDELNQVELQLIDVPVVEDSSDSKDLEDYFDNPKVNKKYRLK